ncbi:alpha/beta fold hydrolase [Nocardioides sp. CFH 31398]|uniref:alpha/beta fold hydrolase n=1 Tax=Nocardioides sp. CFH 31398 TaxID=2919579 RepID=UPI001F05C41B|nr:alpha/beta fold hydrolase [Nocardioides sp. CFH 31398]MCH1865089.1 alpha/beta hydrolase [Nocardioides sp. CFH 31398]
MTQITRGTTRRLGAGLLAGLLGAALAAGVTAPASATPDEGGGADALTFEAPTTREPSQTAAARAAAKGVGQARTPRIRWRDCRGFGGPRARCATVQVPLDYDRPRGATTPLAVLKWRARQPENRIGSLFVNPGGPGGPARGFATYAGRLISPAVDRRFDVIGIDPRGVGASRTAACRGTADTAPFSSFAYPVTDREVRRQLRADDALRSLCDQGATTIVDHATTADNARDMELVRRALGEGDLNYYGVSYGSYLGQTYAALFPGRIRALAVDAILDPIAWSTGPSSGPLRPFTWRLRSGQGAYRALTTAFAECDRVGRSRCDLAPSSATKWRELLRAARDGEIVFPGEPGEPGGRLRESDIVATTLSVMYDQSAFDGYFTELAELHATFVEGDGARRGSEAAARAAESWEEWEEVREEREERGPYTTPAVSAPASGVAASPLAAAARRYRVGVAFQAVGCSDTRNPRDPQAWVEAAEATGPSPWFGPLWTWASSPCAKQGIGDGSDAFRGGWYTRTSTPLLIVGNNYDPATSVRGARRANKVFTGSAFLFYDGYGHGNLGSSSCVTEAYRQYFIHRKPVRNGSTCQPDQRLFR